MGVLRWITARPPPRRAARADPPRHQGVYARLRRAMGEGKGTELCWSSRDYSCVCLVCLRPHRRRHRRLPRRPRTSGFRPGPRRRNGRSRPVGRIPRTARNLAVADRVSAGHGVRWGARHSRRAAAGGRNRHRILGDRARPDGRARGAPTAVGCRCAGRSLRDLPRLRARQGIARRRQRGRVLGRLRHRNRPVCTSPASRSACWRVGLQDGSRCAGQGRQSRSSASPISAGMHDRLPRRADAVFRSEPSAGGRGARPARRTERAAVSAPAYLPLSQSG